MTGSPDAQEVPAAARWRRKLDFTRHAADPLSLAKYLWPHVTFYREQRQILESVVENKETVVTAGNMLGKDFIAGYIAVWFFLTRNPVRIITTSVKDDHLRVMWGEIGRFVNTCKYRLLAKDGGPLIVNHREIKKVHRGVVDPISYLLGMVSEKGEGMAGHHAAHTLLMIDEASGVDDLVYDQGRTWAKKVFMISNPNPCSNFFYNAVKGGDVLDPTGPVV